MGGRIISVDSGSSYMKAVDGHKAVMFPSAVRLTPTGGDGITVNGKRYLVGQEALDVQASHDQRPNTKRWFHGSDEQHAQICHALRELGAKGDYDVLLMTLPYERAREREYQERVSKRSTFTWQDRHGNHEVSFGRIRVTPQGVGALRQYDKTKPGDLQLAMLVDVGSLTTDIVTVRRTSGAWRFVGDACRSSQDVSASVFFDLWSRSLRRIGGFAQKKWGYWALMSRAMPPQNLTWPHEGENVSIASQYHEARAAFADLVRIEVDDASQALGPEIEQIILTGGGAYLVDTDHWSDPRVIVLDVFANAKGQFEHTQQLQQKEG